MNVTELLANEKLESSGSIGKLCVNVVNRDLLLVIKIRFTGKEMEFFMRSINFYFQQTYLNTTKRENEFMNKFEVV